MSPRPDRPSSSAARPRRRAVGDRAMQRATLIALGVGIVLDVLVIVLAAMIGEPPALSGALIGAGLTLVIVLPTVAVAFAGKHLSPVSMAATVLGSWAVKMLIVILVLIAVRDLDAVSTRWIGLALLVGAVSAVFVEAVLLARSRQPLEVEPPEDPSERPPGS
ncbi:MAG: hypothetical protein L0G94_02290 [Brachybacterium sp.]|uniref:hypothetical protein n=1 Tax=Brachybacterium sp. TaxID=1891286 RepID=UPI0026479D99|nr:hypothetical protein [Brachybacterium sp.]MDN5685498.1 hypothetical protein [Brachybacterium sp.]